MENIETLLAAVAQTQGFDDDDDDKHVECCATEARVGNSEAIGGENGGVQVNGDARPSVAVDAIPPLVPFPAAGQVIGEVQKRKRGRPRKAELVAEAPSPKMTKPADEEEDVCFICFDGGSLVLCDRNGCPKAYHPACIKRNETFFKSKAKWTCGWHICSVCQKASHYMCYTCTYSLCKGCTREADFSCVRGNKGFCSTCMKTIMLIENKDKASNESVQVDFDDKSSWEYLFKVYWVILKEKLSLTLSELLQAKNPWKGVDVVIKPDLHSVSHTAVSGSISVSCQTTEQLELNKPHIEPILRHNDRLMTELSSIDNKAEKPNGGRGEDGPWHNHDSIKSNMHLNKNKGKPCPVASKAEASIKESADKANTKEGQNKLSIAKDTDKPCTCKSTNNKQPDKLGLASSAEWASRELLEFVAHMRNGDTSAMSQFDVQMLLLDYIKMNNLRDPHLKSQIVCDQRLKLLFGRSHVAHIEMLKLLEFHFVAKDDSRENSFIPAGLVSSVASGTKLSGNMNDIPVQNNSRKRKGRKKSEVRTVQNNLNEYAAIDVHNINLIYLRCNMMEELLKDQERFSNRVVGSIVRIRILSDDQKQEVYRLVQVVGTIKAAVPYKIGDRSADVMLEVLNLDKKGVVSIDALSNQDFSEDECRRLRQSIKCGHARSFTVGEVQRTAMELQPVRINDLLEAEILQLNNLRDRANENGNKKDHRECLGRLQLLRSPEEHWRRITEVPEIHADPKMSPDYESELDAKADNNSRKGECVRPSCSGLSQNVRKSASNKKGASVLGGLTTLAKNKITENANGLHNSDKHMNWISSNSTKNDQAVQRSGLEAPATAISTGSSPSANHIETENLWHYRDPHGKIQGPFSMMQLRKWSTTGVFPTDMRIWTNHEQYDSVLLTDALNGHFHATLELSRGPSVSQETGTSGGIRVNEVTNAITTKDSKETEATQPSNLSILSENNTGLVREDKSGSLSWPQCWDMLKDINTSTDDVQVGNVVLSYSCQRAADALRVRGLESKSKEFNCGGNISSELTDNQMTSGKGTQNQFKNEDQAGQSLEENVRPLNIDWSLNDTESGAVLVPASKSPDSGRQALNIGVLDLLSTAPNSAPVCQLPDSSKQVGDIDVLDLLGPTLKTAENHHSVSSDVPTQSASILELLSPTPRSNNEDQADRATGTKQSGLLNFHVRGLGPSWSGASDLTVGGVQVSTALEWDSGFPFSSSLEPPEGRALTSEGHQISHPPSNTTNWLSFQNEPIEFDALGEEYLSDLLDAVHALDPQPKLSLPTSPRRFAQELNEDCKDDCFTSIEDFSLTINRHKSDAQSSTGEEIQLTSQSSAPSKPTQTFDVFDSFRRTSGVHSSASSQGETNAPVDDAAPNDLNQDMVNTTMFTGAGTDTVEAGWGTVQGNINLVTVQGNVNLVLGGPPQGMMNLNWGTNTGTTWVNPNMNHSSVNGSLPWDNQGKYIGERFTSPRERGCHGGDSGSSRGRPPWGRQLYGSRTIPKGQRMCKFYESGHCKKGAFCDYLHP